MQAMDHMRGKKRKQHAESVSDTQLFEMLSNEVVSLKKDNASFLGKITRLFGGDSGNAPVSGHELNRLNIALGNPPNSQVDEERLYFVDPQKLSTMLGKVG